MSRLDELSDTIDDFRRTYADASIADRAGAFERMCLIARELADMQAGAWPKLVTEQRRILEDGSHIIVDRESLGLLRQSIEHDLLSIEAGEQAGTVPSRIAECFRRTARLVDGVAKAGESVAASM